jgi:hypothetical protein
MADDDTDLRARVTTLEQAAEAMSRRFGDRLDDGAERFAIQRRQIEQVEAAIAPKPADKWKLAGIVLSVAVLLFTWVWQAARYPDRSEYTALATRMESFVSDMRGRFDLLREAGLRSESDIALLRNRIGGLDRSLARIEEEIRSARARD